MQKSIIWEKEIHYSTIEKAKETPKQTIKNVGKEQINDSESFKSTSSKFIDNTYYINKFIVFVN